MDGIYSGLCSRNFKLGNIQSRIGLTSSITDPVFLRGYGCIFAVSGRTVYPIMVTLRHKDNPEDIRVVAGASDWLMENGYSYIAKRIIEDAAVTCFQEQIMFIVDPNVWDVLYKRVDTEQVVFDSITDKLEYERGALDRVIFEAIRKGSVQPGRFYTGLGNPDRAENPPVEQTVNPDEVPAKTPPDYFQMVDASHSNVRGNIRENDTVTQTLDDLRSLILEQNDPTRPSTTRTVETDEQAIAQLILDEEE